MKKIAVAIALCLACNMMVPYASAASATHAPEETQISMEEKDDGVISSRAISIPTQDAPSSWYATKKYWSCHSYTYSSYIFDSNNAVMGCLDFHSPQQFIVELYYPDGTLIRPPETASYNSGFGDYFLGYLMKDPEVGRFYFIIRNVDSGNPIPASDDTWYWFV